jgi:hypothetical protein
MHVSSITCSSSGVAAQTALGIMRACYVSWLHKVWSVHTIYQISETNVIQFLFNLLRIKDLCIFRALLAEPQEALNKGHLLYCVRVVSVGCIIPL